ncbi:hypothetical protein [Rosenbergiella nectarea]|uniref:hypothetical protein n=1 Tax=Rosenbergiella nectarea TaxID=988801 RepID=UPI001BDB25D2|nr:hypothetical protein [Rosenbergiella nectarea]MBT0729317.1 hypothetical protein [Rosenbergiella nectarea subsp. apis]
MNTTLHACVICFGLFVSSSVFAKNLYELKEGQAITGRVTLIYPVMGKDGMSVRQYQKYTQQSQKAANVHKAGQSTDDISTALSSIWSNTKSAVGVKDEGDKTRVTLPLDHSRDNDPYSEPEDFDTELGEWKGDGKGGYRARIVMASGDIYNLYVNDQQYNQLVATGFRQGVKVQVKGGGKGNNLTQVIYR